MRLPRNGSGCQNAYRISSSRMTGGNCSGLSRRFRNILMSWQGVSYLSLFPHKPIFENMLQLFCAPDRDSSRITTETIVKKPLTRLFERSPIMKRLAMFAATGLIALVPSIASARPHFFFGFPVPFPFFAPVPVVVAPPVVCPAPAPVVVSAPCDPAPVVVSAPVCDPAPVYVAPAPTVIYAPAPVYRYYDYHYYYGPRWGYHYGY